MGPTTNEPTLAGKAIHDQVFMEPLVPNRLRAGDTIVVISPSTSLAVISRDVRDIALANFASFDLSVEFASHSEELTDHINQSSLVSSRLEDLHSAFRTPRYRAIFTTLGGFNCNQLLSKLDFGLIKSNPKIFCGYSDITVLLNAIYAKTGLVTYYGPHFSTLGMRYGLDYTLAHLQRALIHGHTTKVDSSREYRDEPWYLDQETFNPIPNGGMKVIREGQASGTILGGNLCSFILLAGTPWMPRPSGDIILFVEDDDAVKELTASYFQRQLQSIIDQEDGPRIRGIVMGRFQRSSNMDESKIKQMIDGLVNLPSDIPVVANIDFGHTSPMLTIPIGGQCVLDTRKGEVSLTIGHL